MRLKDKVALVTGASQGIGEAIAKRYAKEGAKVAVGYNAGTERANAVVAAIEAEGGTAKAFQADVSKLDDIDRLVDAVVAEFGGLDILVNNAGVFRTVPIMETTEELWDEQLDLNLKGAFFLMKRAIPEFRKAGGGKVVNITSIAGTGAFPNCPGYCASKGGLVNLTRAAACELGKEHINVNSIAPGNVATPLNAHVRGPGNEEYMAQMRMMTPTGRDFLETEEMTGTAVYLASEDSSAVHGETVVVDAGWSAW
ncbi:MAG: SDR family NAD(P)-dependent oxidoreductase [Proteobacteria bacterium]|nr:SDR family NAD(P)-dependent oxidoreductase [Pseudomonadota bacterium]